MLTALWQAEDFREHEWVCELFGSHIARHVYDGQNAVVLDNCILFDKFIHKKPARYYEQFQNRTNVFLFHMSDEQYHGGYDVYRYFDGVFRNYWSSIFRENVLILPLGYSNGVSHQPTSKLASLRKYAWSFAGETTRASRPEMVSSLRNTAVNMCHSTDSGTGAVLTPTAYRDVLQDTVFAPSPMGRLNLECFRLYEALESGCIPIVEKRASFDYFTNLMGSNPLISVRKWSHAPTIIKQWSLDHARLDALQSEISHWWQSKKESLKGEISEFLWDKNRAGRGASSPTRPSYNAPFWQLQELYRHQSPMGLARRLKIQLDRATSQYRQRHSTR
jgi:Exostosin family